MILSIGAGKSSFFNGIESAFEGHVTGRANAGKKDESLTKKVQYNFILTQKILQATLEVVLIVTLVEKMMETVIMMDNARKITSVELTIAEVHLAMNLFMIAALVQKKIFAQFKIIVEWIKVIVIQMLIVWLDLFVD